MPDIVDHTRGKDVGVAALERPRLRKIRDRMASAQILAEEQRVYLRRVSANDHVLVVVRKNLGLSEVAAAKDCRQRARLANILQGACAKRALVFAVSALDVVSFEKTRFFSETPKCRATPFRAKLSSSREETS